MTWLLSKPTRLTTLSALQRALEILILNQVLRKNAIVMIERKLTKQLLLTGSTSGNKSVMSKKLVKHKPKLMLMQKMQESRPKKTASNRNRKKKKLKKKERLMKRQLKKKLHVKKGLPLRNLRQKQLHLKRQKKLQD